MTRTLRFLRHFTAGSLLLCVLLVVALAPTPAVVLTCLVAVVLYVRGLYRWPRSWVLRLLPVGAFAAVVAVVQGADQIWPAVAVPAVLVSAVMASTTWPRAPMAGIALAVTGVAVVLTTGDWPIGLLAAGSVVLCVCGLMAQIWVWELFLKADRDRAREAASAVDQERRRFAADLHDIQGHSLEVIAFKSELAARLALVNPEAAAAEMHEVQELARAALRDTRSVAHGYRVVSLRAEIANAVGVLEAAGVHCTTKLATLTDVPPDTERLLALVVREATTNMIRHSRATEAGFGLVITDDSVRLTVHNNGPLTATEQAEPSPAELAPALAQANGSHVRPVHGIRPGTTAGGQGLAGLEERFAAVGGRLRWVGGDDRFELGAEVPR